MLEELDIRNLGPIREATIAPAAGMTAITGETGAGKSIIIDAVKLVLGERANIADIRVGEDHALVEAVFVMAEGHSAFQTLDDLGLEHDGQTLSLIHI